MEMIASQVSERIAKPDRRIVEDVEDIEPIGRRENCLGVEIVSDGY